jgi:restriction system protein
MAIPDFQSLMLPMLRLAADSREHSLAEAREVLAREFQLTPEEIEQLLPSGRQAVFANRVAWAKVYLTQAGLLSATRRAYFKIAPRGAEVLKQPPGRIDIRFLDKFPEFFEFRYHRKKSAPAGAVPAEEEESETPEEALEQAHAKLRSGLAADLLARIKAASSQFFERLVVELLLKMGYGGSRKEAGEAIGRSGDEGIDGTISEDRLGLDVVYLQAKKWEGTVGRPEIQKFVGALHGKRAKKGVFLTTGTFSADAREYVAHIDPKVVLIDGTQLAELMIDFEVGVTPVANYQLKKIDSDYFGEE